MIYCKIENWVNQFCLMNRTNNYADKLNFNFMIDPRRAIGETMCKIQLLRLIGETLGHGVAIICSRHVDYYLFVTLHPQMLSAFPD